MSGRKPVAKVLAKSKDAPRGTKGRTIAAIWAGRYGWDVSLDRDIAEIRLTDGTVIKGGGREGTHWLSLQVYEPLSTTEKGRDQRPVDTDGDDLAAKLARDDERPKHTTTRAGGSWPDDGTDDLPFAPMEVFDG